ncbi:FG-GAP-like repeat-containing protein [candidate division KSB1 bacterium]|nr:FG-GAP-like repeat-containing protein [candidate division KSB1 bacterium]
MSNKSSTSVISLPKGGGAQKGIGEKFSPDLFTGTGNFTVPIALPTGRNGFQPEINLVYSTGNGNSPFGLGWSLSIPGVSRKTSKGIPRYDDAKDTFILSGAEDLVPVDESAAMTRYRPRTEGLFARIDRHRDASNDYWEVRSKDGLVSLYGTPAAAGKDSAVVANPADRSRVFAWKLSRTTDPFGNRIEYVYERDAAQNDGPHHWDQLYLSEIRYADYGDPATQEQANSKFLVTVKFIYEPRPDPFSEYRAGFEIRTVRRCVRVEVSTHADADVLTRTYHLVYLDQRPDSKVRAPLNSVSLLSQIKVVGHNGNDFEELPPLEFGYTRFEPEKRDFFPFTGPDLPPFSLANPDFELADVIGNGLPDVLQMNGVVRYWRNLGNGKFELPREMREAPAGLQLADAGVQMIDSNGDGRTDLLVTKPGLYGYFPLRFGGMWDRRAFQRYDVAPSFSLEDPEVKLIDLDGDGVTDAIRSGSRLEIFFNDPQKGWNNTRRVERRALEDFPNISFSDDRVKWADMSGDGLQDILLVYDGNIEYWPNLGYGNWGRRVHTQNSPRFPHGYNPKRILVGDVDGDGLADLVYVDDGKVTLWINQSGNRWSDPIEIKGTPPVSDMDAVRLADMLGNGMSGVLWSADFGSRPRESMLFLDFTGGIKPYLLSEMNNHTGAVTRVEYASSVEFYLEDQRQPKTRWKTSLPFPVQVVARVEVIDEISKGKLATEYRYHHGYWDGAEREFRGFGMVEQLDTETFETFNQSGLHGDKIDFIKVNDEKHFSPPALTKTWFHQGPIGDEFGEWEEADFGNEFWPGDPQVLTRPAEMANFLKNLPRRVKRDALRALHGSILRTEVYALDGSAERENLPYTVTESLFGLREESPPSAHEQDRQHVFFSHALAQRTTQWERGGDPLTQFTFSGDYDKHGRPRSQISMAVPRGRKYLQAISSDSPAPEPYLATHTRTDYAQRDDADRHIVDRVARTTTYEIPNDGRDDLFSLKGKIESNALDDPRYITGQTLNFYDGPAFQGLPFGQIGDYGALMRSESVVLTDDILQAAYDNVQPPYLQLSATPNWTADYPEEFRTLLPARAGYVYHTGGEYATGYFAVTQQQRYDFQDDHLNARGLVKATRDPLGRETTITYDSFHLFPAMVTDPVGLITAAVYDYRVLQPKEVTDPNGNRSAFAFTPLGLLESTAVMGKTGENVGDTLEVPGTRLKYDFLAFAEREQPISVHTVKRVHHVNDTDVPLPGRDETIETVEYSDGFGRLLQTRTQAEEVFFGDQNFGDSGLPNDQSRHGDAIGKQRAANEPSHVIVSGWQTYDNKGRVVEKYEPFFSSGFDYAPPADKQFGRKATMFYDPRGQVIRTLNPDGAEQRVIYGVPVDLADPEKFMPTPWETFTYDANDNAGRTHAALSGKYANHWNTPASALIDALGRTIKTVNRNGANPVTAWFITHSTYDIRGNLLTVTDALGRVAFKHVYDLTNHVLRIESIDAGLRRTVLDVMGNAIEGRDSKGTLVLHAYDVLNRPLRLWARDDSNSAVTLRERLEYGDGSDKNQPVNERNANRAANGLGKLYRHFDEAGLLTFAFYDFKGNVLEKARQVISDAAILAVFDPPSANWQVKAFRVDWQASNASTPLDPTVYCTTTSYDGLNRIKTLRYPQDVDNLRKELRPHYNRAGALESVELDGETYVERIAYNAKGQRTLIAYGNGVMTRYAYDPQTFRLVRLCTEHYTKSDALTYHPTGAVLQDFGYEYDLAGNILAIHDRTPESGIPNSLAGIDALDREFSYDPIYRLLSATGREHATQPPDVPWRDEIKTQDPTLTRGYIEKYQYDSVGNILQMQHQANDGSFTREFTLVPGNNRLGTVKIGATPYNYEYDVNGNLIRESTSRHFEWDHADRMKVYRTQAGNVEPSVHAHYLYDAAGQRVKKLVRKQGGAYDVTVHIDGIFEHHRRVQGGTSQENNTLDVMDNQSRIALVRVGAAFPEDTTPAMKFHLGDHLGSSNIVIDTSGVWINREEYTPYGETSFGSFARKRYRYTGKERDEESGLYYHGARYYAPWVARWVSCDPKGMVDGVNLYVYVSGQPIRFIDPDGQALSNRELLGLDQRSTDAYFAKDQSLSTVLKYAGKDALYGAWDLLTGGFVSAHDELFESRERGEISDAEYYAGTAGEVGKSATILTVSTVTGGGAGVASKTLSSAVIRGAAGGFTSGVATETAAQGVDIILGKRDSIDTGQILQSGESGAIFGGVFGGVRWKYSGEGLPPDTSVRPSPPAAKPLSRPISQSQTQNQRLQNDLAKLSPKERATARVNQAQVNAKGVRVGNNRPDDQYTMKSGRRHYVEYDRPSSPRGPAHERRIRANDPMGPTGRHPKVTLVKQK